MTLHHDPGPARYRVELYDPVEIDGEDVSVFEAADVTALKGATIVVRPNGESLTFDGRRGGSGIKSVTTLTNAYNYHLTFTRTVELDPGIEGDSPEKVDELKVKDYRLDHRGFVVLEFPGDEQRRVRAGIEQAQRM